MFARCACLRDLCVGRLDLYGCPPFVHRCGDQLLLGGVKDMVFFQD